MLKCLPFIILVMLLNSAWTTQAQQTNIHTAPASREYQQGVWLFEAGNYSGAAIHFDAFLKQADSWPSTNRSEALRIQARYYQARCADKQNNRHTPQLYRTLMEDYSEHPLYHNAGFYLGSYHFRQKAYEDVITAYEQIEPQRLSLSQKLTYQFKLGYAHFYRRQFIKAASFMDEVRSMESKYYYPAHYYYAYSMYVQESYDEAMAGFRKAEAADMYKNLAPYYITQIYFRQERYDALIDYTEPLLKGNPKLKFKSEIRYLTGQAYYAKKQYGTALPYLRSHLTQSTNANNAQHYQLAYTLYNLEKYEEAIPYLQKLSFKQSSLSQNATYLLADCFVQTGQKKHARNAFREAYRLDYDPKIKTSAHFHYAKLSFELDFHEDALRAIQSFIESYQDSGYLQEARELLSDILLHSRRYRRALEVLDEMDELKPQLKRAYQQVAFYRGVELFNEEKLEASIAHLDKSLEHPIEQKLNAAAHFWQGEAFLQLEQYPKAVDAFNQFLSFTSVVETLPPYTNESTASYNLGYAYYKQERYQHALTYFKRSADALETQGLAEKEADLKYPRLYADVLGRIADCYFLLKEYHHALTAYDKIVQKGVAGTDYALYQQGVIHGLMNEHAHKINVLEQLIHELPDSRYADRSLYELADAYIAIDKPDQALAALQNIETNHPRSPYLPRAINKMALIHYNNNRPEKAITKYKHVITQFPRTEASRTALLGIKNIYVELNRPEEYVSYANALPEANVTLATKDSIMYQAAEHRYVSGICEEAIKDFTHYLNTFPDAYFALQAHFYRGQCLYNAKNYRQALPDYEYVLEQPVTEFTERALAKAAYITLYEIRNYKKALKYHERLYQTAARKQNELQGLKGAVKSAYHLNRFEQTTELAQQLRNLNHASPDDVVDAHYYLGQANYALRNFDIALAEFNKVAAATKREIGVESRYLKALILYKHGKYDSSQAVCFEVINHIPSYDHWIARSFILLADNYVAIGDYFQAKATLKSIIDHHDMQDIREEAQQKLQKIRAKEAAEDKQADTDTTDTNLFIESLPDTIPEAPIEDTLKNEHE